MSSITQSDWRSTTGFSTIGKSGPRGYAHPATVLAAKSVMQTFDQYGANYKEVVQRSIDFAGLQYDCQS
jgi:hypothetical protein